MSSTTTDAWQSDGDAVPVEFSLAELWFLHDFIRADIAGINEWRFPPADYELNRQITDAILACEECGLESFTLLLRETDMLAIDNWVRRDHKTPEGVRGDKLLLKVWKARNTGSLPYEDSEYKNQTYKEATQKKDKEVTDAHSNNHTADNPNTEN